MTGQIVLAPAWIAPPPQGDAELRRHAGWIVRVLNDLARQGLPPAERVRILAAALGMDLAQAPEAAFAEAVVWAQAAVCGAAQGARDRRAAVLLAAPEAGRG